MQSLVELERAAAVLRRQAVGYRIQGVVQPDATSVVLELYGGRGEGRRSHLRLSCDPESAHVGAPQAPPRGAPGPPRFAQYLRAHARGARVADVELWEGDRQLALRLDAREGPLTILLAIFGRRSNVVVLDAERRILMSLRPLAETRPELSPGDVWRAPARSLPRAGEDRFADVPDEAFLAAVEAACERHDRRGEADAQRRRLEQALRKERKSLERKLAKLESDLASAGRDVHLEREGELLKSALSRVQRGDREVVVRDWQSGEDVRIELDPTLGPAENLERLFRRYRKGVRALTKAGAQQDAVRATRDEVAALETRLEALDPDDPEALAAFAGRADVARLLARYAPAAPPTRAEAPRETKIAGRTVPARLAPRRYRTAGELEIWVGRSDAANDLLSTRLARGKDLFFHLDGAPGSHVILRTEGRDDPPPEAVLDACELAVHFSKARKATRADVHVVPCRNVRKPKGAKPGLVMVHGGRTVHLRREPARLARLLDARIEE